MRVRFWASMGATLSLIVVGSLGAPVRGQTPAAKASDGAKPYVPARLPDGQPDVQGAYKSFSSIAVEAPDQPNGAAPAAAAQAANPARPPESAPVSRRFWATGTAEVHARSTEKWMIKDPPDGKIPYQPWAEAKRQYLRKHQDDDRMFLDVRIRCLPSSVPRANFAANSENWHVIQPKGFVVILYEFDHMYRVIPLDGRPHPGKNIELWMGDSRGHWEGNTLVVDVTNFNDKPWVAAGLGGGGAAAGTFHSPALHVVERFTIVGPGRIDYEATIEDPNVFTRPWTIAFPLWTRLEPNFEVYEYACHEGDRIYELLDKLPKKRESEEKK